MRSSLKKFDWFDWSFPNAYALEICASTQTQLKFLSDHNKFLFI